MGGSLPHGPMQVNYAAKACRCKMRMSGLSKVEMSGFMGRRGAMETERIALSQRDRDRLRVLHRQVSMR